MNKLRQILQFIKALLGFLLNLKKKEKDEKKKKWLCRITSRRWLVYYLVILGMTALWADRTEIVLASIGALLTLSGYENGSKESCENGSEENSDSH